MSVLVDKSYKTFSKLSRYSTTPYYYHTLDNKYIVGFSKRLKTTTPYVVHTVQNTDTFDSLALYYYNNPTYFWVICDFNRINDPFKKLVEGEKIKIPSFSSLQFED